MHALIPGSSRTRQLVCCLALLLGVLGNLGPSQIARAATLTVTTTDNEQNVDGDCSLREAVQAANLDAAVDACAAGSGADTITLPAGTYGWLPTITTDLTIAGSGSSTTIIAPQYYPVELRSPAVVSLTGITIRDVDASEQSPRGAGITNYGTLTLTNSVVRDNTARSDVEGPGAPVYGGGIYNEGSLTLNSTHVSGNSVYPTDGSGYGGGIYNSGTLTMTNSVVTGNVATLGAGIFNASSGQITISASTISNNVTGGGHFYYGQSYRSGGGIYNDGGRVDLRTTRVTDNTASANYSSGAGGNFGGIANNNGTMTLTNSVVSNNIAAGGDQRGGEAGGIWNNGTMTLDATTVSANRADGSNGVYDAPGTCGSGGRAAGIDNPGMLTLINSTVSGNRAGGSTCGSANGASGGRAAGIANQGTLTLVSSTISANVAEQGTGDAGAVLPGSGGGLVTTPAVNLRNTLLAGNTASSGTSADCSGPLNSQGYNLIGSTTGCQVTGTATGNRIGVDPLVAPLADNGGSTPTHALLPGSPALDAGNTATPGSGGNACPATDQRGITRPQDGDGNVIARCDIGAFEQGDFVVNGGFEADSNADGTPDAWSSNLSASRSTALARTGSAALRHQASDNGSYTIFSDPVVPVIGGGLYSFVGWVNIPATSDAFSFELQVRWRDASGNVISTVPVKTYTAATTGWTSATAPLTAPANAAQATIRQVVTSLNATIYVDDVTLRPAERNLVTNGGFESPANLAGWSANSYTSASSAAARSGAQSLRHQASDNASYTIFSDPAGPVVAGKSYSFVGWVNIPATSDAFSFELQVRWRDANGNVISTVPVATYTAATTGWTGATALLVAPPNATQATIRQVATGLNATVYVDDIVLAP